MHGAPITCRDERTPRGVLRLATSPVADPGARVPILVLTDGTAGPAAASVHLCSVTAGHCTRARRPRPAGIDTRQRRQHRPLDTSREEPARSTITQEGEQRADMSTLEIRPCREDQTMSRVGRSAASAPVAAYSGVGHLRRRRTRLALRRSGTTPTARPRTTRTEARPTRFASAAEPAVQDAARRVIRRRYRLPAGLSRPGRSKCARGHVEACEYHEVTGLPSCPRCGERRWKCSWMPWVKRMRCRSCGASVKSPWTA
jgi:hypothetical protein